MVIQYKCPDCGADMTFDAGSGKLHCDSCGHEEVIEGAQSDGEFRNVEPEENTATFEDENVVQYQCQNCGAVVISNKDTTATTCSFCGSPVILGDRLSGSLAPTKVIPFTISKEQANEIFRKWCKHARFSPKEFRMVAKLKEITGMYVPFWLFDTIGQGDAMAEGTRSSSHEEGDYTVTETRHYDVYRQIDTTYLKIPADASEKMADDLMDRLEPFDYDELKTFNTPYLAGYLSEKYNYTDKELFPRIKARVHEYMEDYVRDSINGFETVSIENTNFNISEIKADYTLMPVWMVYYQYENAEYTFALNGQTGKIAGHPPIQKSIVAGYVIGLGLIIFIVFRIISILMGGPVI